MTITRTDLVAAFPEFTSPESFPDGQVDFWIQQAGLQLNANRLGTKLDYATMLFVAHNLVLSASAAQTAGAGGALTSGGILTSKSVGSVSAGYDFGSVSVSGAENYNSTTYGQRLWRLLRATSTGPFYVRSPRPSLPF